MIRTIGATLSLFLGASLCSAQSGGAFFLYDYPPHAATIIVRINNPAKIQRARDALAGKGADPATLHFSGLIAKAPACYDTSLSFHVDASTIDFFDLATEVCDSSIEYVKQHISDVGGPFLPGNRWCPWGSRLLAEVAARDCLKDAATNVSAASFRDVELAPESIASAFGDNLAAVTKPASADWPLPNELAGTSVLVKDSAGMERPASLLYVSPTQVNYVVPAETAPGLASVALTSRDGHVTAGQSFIQQTAPALFAANSDGQGAPAAVVLRIAGDGTQSYEPAAQFDAAQQRLVPRPIDLGPESDQVFLLLFGTGIRRRGSLAKVFVNVAELNLEVLYAGPQVQFTGLDQINVRLPRSLAGRGEIAILATVGLKTTNLVRINIQ